jgi:hypothetical protein
MLITTIILATMAVIELIGWLVHPKGASLTPEERDEAINSMINESMNSKEKEMMEATSACVNHLFNGAVIDTIKSMNVEERQNASDNLIIELCSLYQIQLDQIEYFTSNSGIMGAYCRNENKISLNIQYLLCNDADAIREYIDTIIHELRHALQWNILEDKVNWGIAEERQKEWAENFLNYIPSSKGIKLYFMQPVELDAFAFAAGSMKGVRL